MIFTFKSLFSWEWFYLYKKWDRDPIPILLISTPSTKQSISASKGLSLFLGSLLGPIALSVFPWPRPHCLNYSGLLCLAFWEGKPSYFVYLPNCLGLLLFYTHFEISLIYFLTGGVGAIQTINRSIFWRIRYFNIFFFFVLLSISSSPSLCASAQKHLVEGCWNSQIYTPCLIPYSSFILLIIYVLFLYLFAWHSGVISRIDFSTAFHFLFIPLIDCFSNFFLLAA